ncbi:MAG: bifunctional UDP-N-acetylmuramoyl-tripeptide:D-alanyl-D-alanine ligase/alanine racemase [Ferruginibacter sp.]|nr:bifunctional UDP-N-acetylmuramoyl-tripeptide:D-alanyl-D-alanine ligase/alanine racemase [Cytophagales bacterium]
MAPSALYFSDVVRITGGTLLRPVPPGGAPVQYLLTDSRQLTSPGSSLFFAIRGEHHDGHQFVEELHRRGVRQFVVERPACTPALLARLDELTDGHVVVVANSIVALQQIAAHHRAQFRIPVVGITGSNGKTIVKEWLAQLLGVDNRIIKSPKSYNSQVGVPLSVWLMNNAHTLGIFEAGISLPGEMARLQAVIQPTAGIFTNLGSAHDEGFGSRQQKTAEKMRLFDGCETLVYCRDHAEIEAAVQQQLTHRPASFRPFAWSRHQEADLRVTEVAKTQSHTQLMVQSGPQTHSLSVPFVDDASLENALHCIAFLTFLGVDPTEMQRRLQLLRPVAMRLELKEGTHGCYLIDDTYNNDLAGLTMALDFLNLQQQRPRKVLILSDVLESGLPETDLYPRLAELVRDKGVNALIGVGEELSRNRRFFPPDSQFFDSTQHLLDAGPVTELRDSVVLVKGARKFSFERIIARLVQKTHGTVLEVNLDALSHNLNHYRSALGNDTKIMVMVKAFAYGSGSAEVAGLLQFHRVDYLAVAYADEGVALRERGIRLPIMVLNPAEESFPKLTAYGLEPEIYSFRILDQFLRYLTISRQTSLVHLKFDTGMHRLGFEPADFPSLVRILKATDRVTIATVFTHLAAADEPRHRAFTLHQLSLFEQGAAELERALGYPLFRHALNSAGIVRFPQFKMDMVRLGIGLYGVSAYPEDQAQLRPVGTLKTVISQIKPLKAGETVGYGRKGVAYADTTVATIAIGYADGYDRRFGNGVGKVLVNGTRCPTIGNVCMDMTMVDITHVRAEEGDEVIIFGEGLSIRELAQAIGTIPYEILTNVGERVKRVFYKE